MEKKIIVAIDGPAGSGKSTVAKLLAERTGYTQVDTGAIYRSLAWFAHQQGLACQEKDEDKLISLAEEVEIDFKMDREVNRGFVNCSEVTKEIRENRISMLASQISALPGVRKGLLHIQRKLGQHGGVVLEGRDIGTVVFPQAQLKIFLDASPLVRAQRRHLDLKDSSQAIELDQVIKEMNQRDHQDSTRKVAPLKAAEDAIRIDTSQMSIEQVVEEIYRLFREML